MVSTVGPVSKVKPSRTIRPGPATRDRLPLDDDHLVARPHEVAGGAEAGQAGADDDNPAAHRPNVR